MAAIPSTMKALVACGAEPNPTAPSPIQGRGATVREVPVPTLEDDEVLVKVKAVALNPTDFKHVDLLSPPGAIGGCDYAGEVARVGPAAPGGWKVGDRIAGVVHGGLYPDRGSFAEYLKIPGDLAWRVPVGMSDLDATTYGVSAVTAVLGMNESLGLPWPSASGPAPAADASAPPVLVYGASTASGMACLRVAKLAGRTVVATASPANFDLVRSRGADAVFDYHSPTCVADIKAAYPNIEAAFDGISEKGTTEFCAGIVKPGGKIVVLLRPAAPEIEGVKIDYVVAYTMFGKAFQLLPPDGPKFPAVSENREVLKKFYALLPSILDQLRPLPIKELPGGLNEIGEGLNMLREAKASGTKFGYKFE